MGKRTVKPSSTAAQFKHRNRLRRKQTGFRLSFQLSFCNIFGFSAVVKPEYTTTLLAAMLCWQREGGRERERSERERERETDRQTDRERERERERRIETETATARARGRQSSSSSACRPCRTCRSQHVAISTSTYAQLSRIPWLGRLGASSCT